MEAIYCFYGEAWYELNLCCFSFLSQARTFYVSGTPAAIVRYTCFSEDFHGTFSNSEGIINKASHCGPEDFLRGMSSLQNMDTLFGTRGFSMLEQTGG